MIVPMKKILVAARSRERDAVIQCIRQAGVLHVVPIEAATAPAPLLADVALLQRAIELLERTPPAAVAAVGAPGQPASPAAENAGSPRFSPEDVARDALQLDESMRVRRELIEARRRELGDVAVWGGIDHAAIAELAGSGVEVQLWVAPEVQAVPQIEGVAVATLVADDGRTRLITAARRRLEPPAGFAEVRMPERDAPSLAGAIAAEDERQVQDRARLSGLCAHLPMLRVRLRELRHEQEFAEVSTGVSCHETVFVLSGWVPAPRADEVARALAQAGLPGAVRLLDPEAGENPPTLLQNPAWIAPIEALFEMFGITPGYWEHDVSAIFLVFLTLFTAMLFADGGYGLLMFLAILAAYRPLRARGVGEKQLRLPLILFGFTAIYGVLTATYFGVDLRHHPIGGALFVKQLADTDVFLKWFAFVIGAVHMTLAHLLRIGRLFPDRRFLAEIGWISYIWGMFFLVNRLVLGAEVHPLMMPAFALGVVLIVFFTAAPGSSWAGVGEGIKTILLGATGPLSDVISYIRLVAVALAGASLAASFNALVAGCSSIIAQVLLIVAGHGLNVALCLIALFAHGVRLNMLEFGNHLGIAWLGSRYRPFRASADTPDRQST